MSWARRITIPPLLIGCLFNARPASTSPQESSGLTLELSAESATVRVMQQPQVSVRITNRGREPVVLVRPGDGSDRGLRTPLVTWRVEPVAGEGDPEGISGP